MLKTRARYHARMAYLLIVDDDTDGREALCRFLLKHDHEVECVSNGREALASILQRSPDLTARSLSARGTCE